MSLYRWAPYQSAWGCTRYGPAGCSALWVYLSDRFPGELRNLGVCNCRAVVGGSAWSHHAECRALDPGFTSLGVQRRVGVKILELIGPKAYLIGMDHMIMNHQPDAPSGSRGDPRVYSASSPDGRTYTGTHPHKDHNHGGLTRAAGVNLTYGTLVSVFGPASGVIIEEEEMKLPLQAGDGYSSVPNESWAAPVAGVGFLAGTDRSHKIEDVRAHQDRLNKLPGADLELDGRYGPSTITRSKAVGGSWTGNSQGKEGRWWGGNQDGELDWEIGLEAARQVGGGAGVDDVARQAAAAAAVTAQNALAVAQAQEATLDAIRSLE